MTAQARMVKTCDKAMHSALKQMGLPASDAATTLFRMGFAAGATFAADAISQGFSGIAAAHELNTIMQGVRHDKAG